MTDKHLGTYHRTDSPDLMDGGVTAARIEQEADKPTADGWRHGGTVGTARYWRERAEKAEQARDGHQHDARAAASALDRVRTALGLPDDATTDDMEEAAVSRPLTPDAMTAREHLDAAWEAAHVPEGGVVPAGAAYLMRSSRAGRVVTPVGDWSAPVDLPVSESWGERRLLDPPTPARAEGAEEIEAAFETWERSEYLAGGLDGDDKRLLADHIAASVRVVTEEQP